MLPAALTGPEFDALAHDDALWRPAACAILERHGVLDTPRRLGGSALVYAADGQVLKLFPPVGRYLFQVEVAVLQAVDGRLGVATPALLSAGEFEGWP